MFVPRRACARKLAALWLAVAAAIVAMASAEPEAPVGFESHPYAREFAPGEVVRFEVKTPADTRSLQGEFQGKDIAFSRAESGADSATWIAWGVIPLDAKPGPAAYRLIEKKPDGSSASHDAEVSITEKTFPEQRLTVEEKFVNPPKAALARIERERKRLNAIYARRTELPPPAEPFVRPVPGEPTSEFGLRRIFNGEPRAPHSGIDLRAATGTPVRSAGPGRVAIAADLYYSGGTVIVDHGGGLFTVYAHLSKLNSKEGATVKAGDVLGLSGATGRVTGPHLHWGAKVGPTIFDPRSLLDPRLFGSK